MRFNFLSLLALLIIFTGCRDDHFISDRVYRLKVINQFHRQNELAKNRQKELFDIMEGSLSLREKEALQFLYAYSSLNDLADYTGDFFLSNIRASFAARDTFRWGKIVPEELFRHFVLPIRVNNENLDSSRMVFFEELKERVKNLPMKEAALEVNHWCHEKVQYRGTDGRTSSPLATVKTAYGRCGEESTFTVAALRSVSIPARQCYTPRWAHSDDNHAWVEVWVDGKWHFMGACEPDADLDLAWFTQPARRAMLVNTTVFGNYEGPEEVLVRDSLFTRINVLDNYAPVKKVTARVLDADGHPADSVHVEFQLYNYAEFYPLHSTMTDKKGTCSFTTGYGDLLVWAGAKSRYGFAKLDARIADTAEIRLEYDENSAYDLNIDLIPPAGSEVTVNVSDDARKRNNERLAMEDKIRTAYENTFIDSVKAYRFAGLVKMNSDTLWSFLHRSRGNWRELTDFISGVPAERKYLIFPLLGSVSEKDLRDISPEVLDDAINNTPIDPSPNIPNDVFHSWVLAPRVDNEWLRPNRARFRASFDADFIALAKQDPQKVVEWVRQNITLDYTHNYSRAPITPTGVFELKVADKHSAGIFFTALCRSFGIPSRLDPATKVPQYMMNMKWTDVVFGQKEESGTMKTALTLSSSDKNPKLPEYSIHYTLETYEDGFFRTLDYEGSKQVSTFPCTLEIPARQCLLVTGTRSTDGSVYARLKCFSPQTTPAAMIEMREAAAPGKSYGKLISDWFDGKDANGLVIAWIEQGNEPVRHLLNSLKQNRNAINEWNGYFLLVFPDELQMKEFTAKEGKSMPEKILFTFQPTFPIKISDLKLESGTPSRMPVVIYANKEHEIIYLSEGYRLGTGDEITALMK